MQVDTGGAARIGAGKRGLRGGAGIAAVAQQRLAEAGEAVAVLVGGAGDFLRAVEGETQIAAGHSGDMGYVGPYRQWIGRRERIGRAALRDAGKAGGFGGIRRLAQKIIVEGDVVLDAHAPREEADALDDGAGALTAGERPFDGGRGGEQRFERALIVARGEQGGRRRVGREACEHGALASVQIQQGIEAGATDAKSGGEGSPARRRASRAPGSRRHWRSPVIEGEAQAAGGVDAAAASAATSLRAAGPGQSGARHSYHSPRTGDQAAGQAVVAHDLGGRVRGRRRARGPARTRERDQRGERAGQLMGRMR